MSPALTWVGLPPSRLKVPCSMNQIQPFRARNVPIGLRPTVICSEILGPRTLTPCSSERFEFKTPRSSGQGHSVHGSLGEIPQSTPPWAILTVPVTRKPKDEFADSRRWYDFTELGGVIRSDVPANGAGALLGGRAEPCDLCVGARRSS